MEYRSTVSRWKRAFPAFWLIALMVALSLMPSLLIPLNLLSPGIILNDEAGVGLFVMPLLITDDLVRSDRGPRIGLSKKTFEDRRRLSG